MFPEAFLTQMRALLGAEFDSFLAALDAPPALALRGKRAASGRGGRGGRRTAAIRCRGRATAITCVPAGVPARRWRTPVGRFICRRRARCCPRRCWDAQPGERILDLCAAPGGKSGQIGGGAARARRAGEQRARAVAGARAGGKPRAARRGERRGGVAPIPSIWRRAGANGSTPCSSTRPAPARACSAANPPPAPNGSLPRRRDARAARRKFSTAPRKCFVPAGGWFYSTCTFNRLENEGSVESFLDRHPEFHSRAVRRARRRRRSRRHAARLAPPAVRRRALCRQAAQGGQVGRARFPARREVGTPRQKAFQRRRHAPERGPPRRTNRFRCAS